jgi:hypothetical protein
MQRDRHMEFIRFHNAVEREVRAEKPIHGARQLCHRQASQSAGLALPRSALVLSLHPRPPPLGWMRSRTSLS